MVQFISDTYHDFALKTLETYAFFIPIHDTPSSTILVEYSLEGKYYHCPIKCLYGDLPQPDT